MSLILSGTNGLSDVDGSAATPAIRGTDTNTGIFFPAADTIAFAEGGVEAMRLDSSGNMGLGVTPTNNTLGKTLQVGQSTVLTSDSAANRFWLGSNWYYNAGDKYIANGYSTLYSQQTGTHQWFTAASGTAGNAITFTQAMTLDASGNLGVGTTSLGLFRFKAVGTGGALGGNGYFVGMVGEGAASNKGVGFGYDSSSQTGIIYSETASAASNLAFWTYNGSAWGERARIDSSGNLLVGTTGLDGRFRVEVGGATWARVTNQTNGGTQYFDSFRYSGTEIGKITGNNSNVTYATSSDYRLKENIAPMTGALAIVAQLKPCTYTWKIDGSSGQGFIAHELQEVVPDAVVGEKDAVKEDGSIDPQGIDTSYLVATLTAAIQEQQAIITQLQADVAALKGQA